MKDHGKSYQMDLMRIQDMVTLGMIVNSWKNQHFDIHWEHMVDLRQASQMRCFKGKHIVILREDHL